MPNYGIPIVIGAGILILAIPYVSRIRHRRQRPLAAYLIFVSVFAVSAAVLFSAFGWLAAQTGIGPALTEPGFALLFLLVIFGPAVALATWQTRKPPWRRGPPH